MSERDTQQIIMAVQKATVLMDPVFKLTAAGAALLITYLARMVKEHKIKKGEFKNVQEFMKATDGQYNIVNVPVPTTAEELKWLGSEGFGKEMDSLREMGVRVQLMPDLNKSDGFEQLMIQSDDMELFSGWYERYLQRQMRGGEHLTQDLQNLTNGKTTLVSIPFEENESKLVHDFEKLGINYSILPDLNVGDGEIQIMVASSDIDTVKYWYGMYQNDQLAKGNEVKDMNYVNMEDYTQTGNMTEEEYINTASPELQKANEKYENRKYGEIENSVIKQENRIRSTEDVAYEQYHNNPGFTEITINKETLVEKSSFAQNEKIKESGLFASRIPTTYGKDEQTLILPNEQVFLTDDGKTYIAFLEKDKSPLVMLANGMPVSVTERKNGEKLFRDYYDKVEREFYKKEQLSHTANKVQESAKSMATEKIPSVPIKIK